METSDMIKTLLEGYNLPPGISVAGDDKPWNQPDQGWEPELIKETLEAAKVLKELLQSMQWYQPGAFNNGYEMDKTMGACQLIIDALGRLED